MDLFREKRKVTEVSHKDDLIPETVGEWTERRATEGWETSRGPISRFHISHTPEKEVL